MIFLIWLLSLKLAKILMSLGGEGIGEYKVTICEEPQTVEALILISKGTLSTNTLVFGVSI